MKSKKNLRDLIKLISIENGINPKVGDAIINNLFKQLREEASKGNNVRIIKLGLFYDDRNRE